MSATPKEDDNPAFEDISKRPHAFIQWKGTNVCMDVHCSCGAHCHFDGDFAYAVQCPHCETVWEMPQDVPMRRADDRTYAYWRENPMMMIPDEDMEAGSA